MTPKSLVGPLFWWEILRQSRRAQGHLARACYALALLAWLGINLGFGDTFTAQTISQRTENCVNGYLVAQYLAVLIFTPVFVVSAVVEDRKRGTYELLLTTFLSGREILLDKMTSRMLQVLGVLAAGVPVLAVLQMLGGVNLTTVLTHSLHAVLLLIALAGYSLRGAVACDSVGSGVAWSLIVFLFVSSFIWAGFSIIGFQLTVYRAELGLLLMLLLQLPFAWLMVREAASALEKREPTIEERERALIVRPDAPVESGPASPAYQNTMARPAERARFLHSIEVPPLGDYPIIWKERYFPLPNLGCIIPMAAMTVCFALYVLIVRIVNDFETVSPVAVVVPMLLFLLTVSMRACVTFGEERERKTLGDLLLLPMRRQFLIFHKWFGCIVRYMPLATASACVIVLILAIRFNAFVAIVPLFLVQFCFYTIFALRLSLSRLSTRQARLLILAVLLLSNAAWMMQPVLKETWLPQAFLTVCLCSPALSAMEFTPWQDSDPIGSISYRHQKYLDQLTSPLRWTMYTLMLPILALATWLLFRSCDRALQRFQERYND